MFRPDHNGECLTCDEWADTHSAIALLRGRLVTLPITVERIRNEASRQTRFVVFSEAGEILVEGRHEVVAAWVDGYLCALRTTEQSQ